MFFKIEIEKLVIILCEREGLDFIRIILSRKDNDISRCVCVCVSISVCLWCICMHIPQSSECWHMKGTNASNQMYCMVLLENGSCSPRLIYGNLDQILKRGNY